MAGLLRAVGASPLRTNRPQFLARPRLHGFYTYCWGIISSTKNSLKAVAQVASLLALVFSGLAACGTSESNEVIVSTDATAAPTQVPTAAPAVGAPATPEQETPPPAPPLESGLAWAEVDLNEVFDLDHDESLRLESVGDGRVLALIVSPDVMSHVLVTENGLDWAALSIPSGFSPWSVDISGDRWIIQGLDTREDAPGPSILFSDDRGSNWTDLAVDLGSFDGTAWIANAIVAGPLIVVMVQSDTWRSETNDAFDDDMGYEPSEERVHLFLSNGGPAEFVAEFPGWASGGHGASDGFHLLLYGPDGDQLLYSPDGRQWSSTIVDVEITDSARNEVWTADQTDGKFKVERFEGVFGSDQVLTLPDGIGWMPDLAVGPAGVAAVGGPESPYDEPEEGFTLPDISFEKDGYELRYNQPEGGITLWDLEVDSAVYVFDAETLQNEEPPDVVQEVEDDDGSIRVVFHDPKTGAELVAFSGEELAEAVMEAALEEEETVVYHRYQPEEFLVGWSQDGTDWAWQTLQEAFGLPENTQDDSSFTEVQVAVGHDYVIAKVQTFVFPEADLGDDIEVGVGDAQPSGLLTAPDSFASPPRWFIARVG